MQISFGDPGDPGIVGMSIDLCPSYLPGRMNTEADALSRHQDQSEWMLDPVIAQNLFLRFGRPKIDLFASAQTRQVRRYFSADLRDRTALGIDAFLQSWEDLGSPLYAFPPPMLIPLVLARVHQLSAQMILITPWWPRAPWLPELMTMSVCIPYRLPIHQTSVIDVTSNTPLAELDKLRMTAWLISAEPFKNEASHLIWPHSYSRHGNRPHSNHTHQHGTCGVDGVADRAWTLLRYPSTNNLTQYLWYLYSEKKYAWSTLGVYRSAISTLLQPFDDKPIGSDKVISLFMRASYMSRPPLRKLNPIWDVGLVLRKLAEWGDVLTLSRSRLTHRFAMLLASASAMRVSDMFLLCVHDQHLRILPTKWTFLTAFGAKQERQTHSVHPITFNQNVDCSRPCPVAHLVEYMKRTCVERQKDTSHKLFRTTVFPFRPAAESTIAKWLVLVLSDAGTTNSAGSTRAAAVTWSTA